MASDDDQVLAALDKCPATPDARANIAYHILLEATCRDALVDEIMAHYRSGFTDDDELQFLTQALWKARDTIRHPSLYLAVCLLPRDEALDGFLAEYIYGWAEELGVPERRVSQLILELGVRRRP